MARYVVSDNVVFWRQQKPSLLVVVGSGPAFNPAQQIFARPRKFFSDPSQALVQRSTWQVQPSGVVGYSTDISHNTYAKVFVPEDTFPRGYAASPRTVTDFFSNADIFAGFDTVGWPDSPEPPSYPQAMRGAFNTIQAIVVYNPAPDVWLLRKQDKYFPEVPIQWGPTLPFFRSVQDRYQSYNDVPRNSPQAKVFVEYQTQWNFNQPLTQNILFTTPIYNPAIDVILFKRQDKTQLPDDVAFQISQKVTANAINFFPPPYNPGTDVRFPRRIQFSDLVPEIFIRSQTAATIVWNVPQIIPPPVVLTSVVVPNYGGRVVLSPKFQGEKVIVPVDFISRLAVGETILTANVTATVQSGVDPNPQALISGAAGIFGTIVEQAVTQGVLGVTYDLQYTITTSLGQTLILNGYYSVVPSLP